MDWSFWEKPFGGMTMGAYLKFVLILMVTLLLKRYISVFLSHILYRLFRRSSNQDHVRHFKKLLIAPFDGLIVTVFLFIAVSQLRPVLENLVIMRFPRTDLKVEPAIFTLQQLIYHAFFFALIYYIALLITRLVTFLFFRWRENAEERQDWEKLQLLPLLKDILNVIVWCLAAFTVLGLVFHVNIAALVTGLGIGGIIVAFAAKDSIENLLASLMVLIDKPFSVGDWIKINGVEGNVERVGFRSTHIRSFDRSLVVIPNRTLITENLENFSERGSRRILFYVRAQYGLNKETLQRITKEISQFIKTRSGVTGEPIVSLESFGEIAINIQVIYYIYTQGVDYLSLVQEINYGIYTIMYEHGGGFALPAQVPVFEPSSGKPGGTGTPPAG